MCEAGLAGGVVGPRAPQGRDRVSAARVTGETGRDASLGVKVRRRERAGQAHPSRLATLPGFREMVVERLLWDRGCC